MVIYSILSRFSDDEEDFFLHYMLQKVLCVNVVNLSHDMTSSTVFDFLLYLFPKMLNDAMAQGLYKAYRWKDYNNAHVRGTIDLNRHLKVNLPFRGKVAYHTREFSYDNPVTELIRHTIEYLGQHTLGKALLVNDARTRDHVAAIRMATQPQSAGAGKGDQGEYSAGESSLFFAVYCVAKALYGYLEAR